MKEKKVEREIKKNNRTHTRNTEYVIIIFFVVYKINSMQNTNKKNTVFYFIDREPCARIIIILS